MTDITIEEAKRVRRSEKFKPYTGKKLKGERGVIGYDDKLFPSALRVIPNPPKELYVVGDPHVLQEGLAVVGARRATPYGVACAKKFSRQAARRGILIVSGGACGCDAAAHQAALDAGGTTAVFLGGGCDELYPASNQELFQEIIDKGGVVVSEYSWEYPPLKHTFLARNRLIAGLARATLIVEAGLPSGTFSTADEALAASREVLVVPGAITSASSHGANRLLYQGATPVIDEDSFEDILSSLFGLLKQEDYLPLPQKGKKKTALLAALEAEPLRMEEMLNLVQARTPQEAKENLLLELMDLQKEGVVARYPDGRYGPAKV